MVDNYDSTITENYGMSYSHQRKLKQEIKFHLGYLETSIENKANGICSDHEVDSEIHIILSKMLELIKES